MTTVKTIAKNTFFLGISQVIVTVIGFFLFIFIARNLGEIEFGKYNFALTFTSLFSILADVGISNYLIREIARNKQISGIFFTNVLIIKLFLSFITFILIVISINLLDYPGDTIYIVYLFGIYSIINSFAIMVGSYFRAIEKMEYIAFILIFQQIIVFLLSILTLSSGYGLIGLAYVNILSSILILIVVMILLFLKVVKPEFSINIPVTKMILLGSLPFGLNALFGIIYFRIDTILLSLMKGDAAVGIYNAAFTPILAVLVIADVFLAALFPVMSRYYILSKESLGQFTRIASKFLFIISLPMAIGGVILAPQFIHLLYNGQYIESQFPFQILSLFLPIRFVSAATGLLLTSINKQSVRTISVGLGALVNIILNIILIPTYSYIGAGIATVVAELFLYFILIYFINRYYKKLFLHSLFLKPIIATSFLGAFIFYFSNINLLLLILLSISIYSIMLIVLGTLSREEWELIKELIKRDIK